MSGCFIQNEVSFGLYKATTTTLMYHASRKPTYPDLLLVETITLVGPTGGWVMNNATRSVRTSLARLRRLEIANS